MDTTRICNVKNRSAGMVVYSLPEIGVRREFTPGEVKKISFEELERLSYQSGGRVLIENYLQITEPQTIKDLNVRAEAEYFMSEQQIVDLIKNGSLDEFLDCLDFAPIGVLDLLKDLCVKIPLTDYDKRQAMKEKTGFDVDAAIKNIEEERAEQKADKKAAESAPTRRVKKEVPAVEEASPARRVESKYKIIEQ